MALLVKIYNAQQTIISGAPGKSVQADIETAGMNLDDAEIYHVHGLHSVPVDGISGAMLDVGDNNIIIATHDYRLNKTLDKGETLLYSIDADGVIKSSAKLDKTGNFIINEGTKSSVSHAELNTALQNMVTAFNTALASKLNGSGSAGTVTLDISAAEVPEVKLP